MTLSRPTFFAILFLVVSGPFLIHKIIWLAGSEKTMGTMSFKGKSYTGQLVHSYSVIWFVAGRDTVWFNGNDNIHFKPEEKVPVRYQRNKPVHARIDQFIPIWGDTLVYGGIPVLILLIVFFHPGIIPRRSRIRLHKRKPFAEVV